MKHLVAILMAATLLFLFSSCSRDSKRGNIEENLAISDSISELNDDLVIKESIPITVNLYIENSGSMNGYVSGRTQFKDALQNLLVDLKYPFGEENINLFFINNQIHKSPIKANIVDFADKLSPKSIKIGHTGSSNLNEIFRKITSKSEKNTVSILFSDFIYSIKGKNTVALLGEQKALTRDVFLTASKNDQNLTTNIYQYSSDFDGIYYDFNDDKHNWNQSRPYYIAIIGDQPSVSNFTDKIGDRFKTYSGYKNEYILTEKEFDTQNYTVLLATMNKGKFKPLKHKILNNQVKGIQTDGLGRNENNFQIAIAVDFNGIPVTDEYITTTSNYNVSDNKFKLIKVGKLNGKTLSFMNGEPVTIPSSDLIHLEAGFTHVLVFESVAENFDSLEFSLKRTTPKWVEESTTTDDTDIETNKENKQTTFGLSYLVDGITEAYLQSTGKEDYIHISIPIENKTSSSFLGKMFGFLFGGGLIALIVLIIIKNKKRK
jgi:hypothetical protein